MTFSKKAVLLIYLLLISTALLDQKIVKSDTVKISGQTIFLHIPTKEEIKKEIRNVETSMKRDLRDYVADMQNQQFISDNVITDVSLEVIGDDVLDLKVIYEYSLKNDTMKFQTDDFPLGEYRVEQSNAALVTFSIIKKTMNGQLAKYTNAGQKISFTIQGNADAVALRGVIEYNGEFGPEINEECEVTGSTIRYKINEQTDIQSNYQLAFIRAYSVKNYILKNIEKFWITQNKFFYKALVSDFKGGKYRRVSIEIVIHDAFGSIIPK